jgi:catechol 2,3-dioxygenase-like lactoylglutathione lyase family enzyme
MSETMRKGLLDGWKNLLLAQAVLLAGFILYAAGESFSPTDGGENKMKINSFDGVTIIVKDFEAQKKFYRDVLGLEVESEYPDAIFFKIGDKKLGLFARGHHKEGDESLEGASKGISHFEFGVTGDAARLLSEKLKKQGFHAYRDVFKDADGNLFHFNLDGKVNY